MSDIKSRGDVVNEVAAQVDLPRTQVDAVLKAFESSVARSLASGGEIRMAGFGTFKTSQRGERTSRNPRTGEPVKVEARTVPRFSPGKGLKDAANPSGAGKGKGGKASGSKDSGAKASSSKASGKSGAKKK